MNRETLDKINKLLHKRDQLSEKSATIVDRAEGETAQVRFYIGEDEYVYVDVPIADARELVLKMKDNLDADLIALGFAP